MTDAINEKEEQDILLERARILRKPLSSGEQGGLKEMVAFLIKDRGYAVDVQWVREIFSVGKITPIPKAPTWIIGAINVRGNIITLTDLELFLGLEPFGQMERHHSILLLESPLLQTGIPVEQVTECRGIPESLIEPPLVTLEEHKLEYLQGEIRMDGRIYAYLNMGSILKDPRLIVE